MNRAKHQGGGLLPLRRALLIDRQRTGQCASVAEFAFFGKECMCSAMSAVVHHKKPIMSVCGIMNVGIDKNPGVMIGVRVMFDDEIMR